MKNIPSMLVVLGAIIVSMSQAATGFDSLGDIDNKIMGGDVVKSGEFPFLVSLAIDRPGENNQCGGSIIDDRHIITAAHCVYGSTKVEAKLGCHEISKCKHSSKIDRQWIHHEYKVTRNLHFNDVAILRTKDSINFTDLIKPVSLPDRLEDDYEIGESLTVAGWGKTHDDQGVTDIARKVDVEVKTCPVPQPLESHVCAGSPSKGGCVGDAGGPLFRTDKASKRSTIVGIVSTGPSCTGRGTGGQYTRVPHYLGWIESIKKESQATV
uniref:Plasma kallikrein n=1 Tax=Aceria tosichella TaxID=561515 RepID=A0A6G1SMW2_9ACAR